MDMNEQSEPSGPPDNRPLDERIGDKNWKTRSTAYTDLKSLFKSAIPDDPIFDEYVSWMPKLVNDSNASALDTGLDTVLIFAEMAPVPCIRQCVDRVCEAIVDKALGANKASSQQKGKAIILKFMEVDDPIACANILITKFTDKKPKIPPVCLGIILEGIALFGARPFPIKEIISSLPAVLEGSNGPAREAAMTLIVEMTRWIGRTPFNSLIEGMRSAQKTDFERLVAAREDEPKPTPSLYLRKDRAAAQNAANNHQSAPSGKGAKGSLNVIPDAAVDPREYVEEVDLNKRLQKSEYSSLINEEKWSEQLKALQLIIDIIGSTPKLKPGTDTQDIIEVCKGFLRQGHVQLQVSALKIFGLLADGLRAEFGPTIRTVTQIVIMKCKEKRLTTEVTFVLVNALKYCLGFDSLLDDVCEHIRNKKTPPHGRVCLMEFIALASKEFPERINADCMKPLVDALVSVCEDSDPKVRDCACTALANLAIAIRSKGRNAIEAHRSVMSLEQSLPRVFKKVQNAMESSSGSSSPTVSSAPSPSIPAPKPQMKASTAPEPQESSIPKNTLKKSIPVSSAPAKATKKQSTVSSGPAVNNVNDDNVDDLALSPEEASTVLEELGVPGWNGEMKILLNSAKWQDKVDAMERIERFVVANSCGGAISAPFVAYCKGLFPSLKISNVSVFKAVVQALTVAAQNSGETPFSRPAAFEILMAWGDKMSDKKTSDLIGSLLTSLSESISPAFAFKQMKKVMDKTKAPLGHQHFLEWLKSCIAEFGAPNFPVQVVAAFCQSELENKTATVRTAAVEVLGALYYQLGTRFTSMAITESMKPALKTMVEAEIQRVGYDPNAASKAPRAAKPDGNGPTNANGVIPRVDLNAALDKNILAELTTTDGKNSWQNRKSAIEAIIQACERSGHFIESNSMSRDIIKALKDRLNDTQANLKPLGAAALGHLLSSLDVENSSRSIRSVVGDPLVAGVSDNKKVMRDACISSLQMIVTCGKGENALPDASLLVALLPSISEAALNPVGRLELLGWLLTQLENPALVLRYEWVELLKALVVAMQDKIAATRTIAEQVFCSLMSHGFISRNDVIKSFRDLPPATLRPLQTAVDRITSVQNANGTDLGSSVPQSPSKKESREKEIEKDGSNARSRANLKSTLKSTGSLDSSSNTALIEDSKYFPLKKTTKTKRLEELNRYNWPQPPEDPGESELTLLKSQWESLLAPELFSLFFPEAKSGVLNQDSVMNAMSEMICLVDGAPTGTSSKLQYGSHVREMVLQHTDLMIRWCALTLCLRESSSGCMHLLLLLSKIFDKIRSSNNQLHESEILVIIPALIERSGHKSERHKAAFKSLLLAARYIIPVNKFCQYLLQGLKCKNKKTRVVCIEIIDLIIAESGPSVLGKQGIKEIGSTFNTRDTDVGVRNAALDFCFTLYVCVGSDKSKLMKLLGDITEKAVPMIEHRIKEKIKSLPNNPSQPTVSEAVEDIPQDQYTEEQEDGTFNDYRDPTLVLTPYENRKDENVYDEICEPFRLEMTPPVLHKSSNRNISPRATLRENETHAEISLAVTDDTSVSEVESICVDVLLKVDTLLSSSTPNRTMGERNDILLVTHEAKDYLKILHSLLKEEWIAKQNITRADNEMLYRRVPSFIDLSIRCLQHGFITPPPQEFTRSISTDPIADTADIGLISISLSIMFAVLDRPDLSKALTEECVKRMLEECVRYLLDPRISNTEEKTIIQSQISKGLNAVILKLSRVESVKSGVLMCAIIDNLLLCIPEKNHARGLSPKCVRPLSRLLMKLMADERSRGDSAYRLPNVDSLRLLSALNIFFNSHPAASPSDQTPYCCAKTLLYQMMDCLGVEELSRILKSLKIPQSSFISRLLDRLSQSQANSQPNLNSIKDEIASIIERITTARDKTVPIRELHIILKNNPDIDASIYLQHISTTFQRFVLDTLQKLDAAENPHLLPPPTVVPTLPAPSGALADSTNTLGYMSPSANKSGGSEALRILEGLKSRPKTFRGYSALGTPGSTVEHVESDNASVSSTRSASTINRAQIQDKIRGTLSSISASLSLEPTPGSPLTRVSSAHLTGTMHAHADSDLAARIQRLKGMSER